MNRIRPQTISKRRHRRGLHAPCCGRLDDEALGGGWRRGDAGASGRRGDGGGRARSGATPRGAARGESVGGRGDAGPRGAAPTRRGDLGGMLRVLTTGRADAGRARRADSRAVDPGSGVIPTTAVPRHCRGETGGGMDGRRRALPARCGGLGRGQSGGDDGVGDAVGRVGDGSQAAESRACLPPRPAPVTSTKRQSRRHSGHVVWLSIHLVVHLAQKTWRQGSSTTLVFFARKGERQTGHESPLLVAVHSRSAASSEAERPGGGGATSSGERPSTCT